MSDTVSPSGDDSGPGGPPQPMPPAPGGPPGGPGGGGIPPVLAAIARARMQPQATQPGMGTQAGGLQTLAMAVDLLQKALPSLSTGSQEHTAVLNAIKALSRHTGGGGAPGDGAQQTAIQDMMRNQMRNLLLRRLIAAQQGGQGGPGGPPGAAGGAPGGGAPGPGMSPSIPMPGS